MPTNIPLAHANKTCHLVSQDCEALNVVRTQDSSLKLAQKNLGHMVSRTILFTNVFTFAIAKNPSRYLSRQTKCFVMFM